MHGLRTAARIQWLGFWAALIGVLFGPAAFGVEIITGTLNAGGGFSSNSNYTIKSSVGEIAGSASAAAPARTIQSGFIGQISGWAIPVASFSVTPTIIGESNSVTFTDLSTGPITNRVWTFGDGTTSNTLATSVTHPYNSVGTNTVKLTVYGPAGYASLTLSNAVTVWPKSATPAVAPAGGQFTNSVQVAFSSATPGAVIYYTTDGSTPTTNTPATVTSGGLITLLNSATVQALALAPNTFPSPVATASFTIINPLPIIDPPTFAPAGRDFADGVAVVISCTTPGATIRYTAGPRAVVTTNSPVYTGPITLTASTTLNARAFKAGFNPSATATATYTVLPTATLKIVTLDPLPVLVRGLPYNLTFAAVNGTPPYTWSASGLPTGLKLSKKGVLTGTPTVANNLFDLLVTVTDAANNKDLKEYLLIVTDPADTFNGLNATYSGLVIETNNPSQASSGFIQLVLSKTGSFAGNLILGGAKTTFKGQFDLVTTNAAVTSGQASLILQLDEAHRQIIGTVSHSINAAGNVATSELVADMAGLGQNYAGTYALVFAPTNSADATVPQGFGYATLIVNAAGSATLSGALADGTALAAKAAVSKDGIWPLYASLYGNTGSCISWITLTNQTAAGLVDWYGPAKKGSAASFTTAVDLFGAAPLTGAGLASAQVVILSGGGLASVFTNQVTVDLTGKVKVGLPNTDSLTLKFTPKTGKFTGTFKLPAGGRAIPFNGLMLQPATGNGFFLNSGHSGAVQIESAVP